MLTEAQLKARKGKITSSIAAACLGLTLRITPAMAKERILGLAPFQESKAIDRGNTLEDYTLDYPCRQFGLTLVEAEFRQVEDWAGDSADCLYLKDGKPWAVGEAKTVNHWAANGYGEEGTDDVPYSTLIQAHWHLIHWPEVDRCIVPVLLGGNFEFTHYVVHRDQAFADDIWHNLKDWHQRYIIEDQTPPLEAADHVLMDRWFPRDSGQTLDPTPQMAQLARDYVDAHDRVSEAQKDKDLAKTLMQAELGEMGLCEQNEVFRVSWKRPDPRPKTNWQGMAEQLIADLLNLGLIPDREAIVDKWTEEKQGARTFRVKLY